MDEAKKRRLLWRCRRGTKELDLILQQFLESDYEELCVAQQARFDELLDTPDPVLTEWLCFEATPPEGFQSLVTAIRSNAARLK